ARPPTHRRPVRTASPTISSSNMPCSFCAARSRRCRRAWRTERRGGGTMNRFFLLLVGALAGFGLAVAASHFAYGAIGPRYATEQQLGRFGEAFQLVRENYLQKPEDKNLVENAIGGMLTNLDAHSSYFDPQTYAAMQTKAAGAYGGIGLVVT